MENLLVQHFKGILTEPNIRKEDNIHKISQHITNIISRDHNLALLRVIMKVEVEEVIKNIEKNTTPGPHGFTTKLFQATWTFMRKYIVNVVEESRCTKIIHLTLNTTFLSLIPKIGHSEGPQGF